MLSALMRGQLHQYHARVVREYGENVQLRFPAPWNQMVLLTDPAAIQEVIVVANPPKPPEITMGLDWATKGVGTLVTAKWEEWLVQRRLVSPAMSERLVGSWQAIFEEQSVPLMAHLEAAAVDDSVVEMDALLMEGFLGIISRITLGRRLDDDVVKELLTDIGDVLDEAMRHVFLPALVADTLGAATPTGRRCRDARTRVMATMDDSVGRRREARAAAAGEAAGVGITGNDGGGGGSATGAAYLLDLLLDAEAEGVISAAQVSAQLQTFIVAGHDTTAHTLSFLLYEVCAAPHLQDELAAEAAAALPGRLDFPTRETLRSVPLLGRIFKEALRKHPVAASGTFRALSSAVRLPSGERLPAGARVGVPNFAVHRNPGHWPDPEKFDPDQFTPEASKGRHKHALQAFSSGPRACIGQALASAEALSVLAAIFRRFELRLVDGPGGEPYPDGAAIPEPADHNMITRKPANGVWFKVTARSR
jgi:cytochrome P450